MEKKQYYSIRKHKKGAVSVLLFTALFAVVGAGDNNEVKASDVTPLTSNIRDKVVPASSTSSLVKKNETKPLISEKTDKIVTNKVYNEAGAVLKRMSTPKTGSNGSKYSDVVKAP